MAVDPEIGIDKEHAFIAVEAMRPHIQKLLDKAPPGEVVGAVIAECFLGCLKSAGLSGYHFEKASKQITSKLGGKKAANFAVQKAYEPLAIEVGKLIDQGLDPLAIAWSFIGAIRSITTQLLGHSDQRNDLMTAQLIELIDKTRNNE